MDCNSGPTVPFPWSSGYWPVPSSDEALQITGLFNQGQFPCCSGYEARRVQHFPDFNLESIFITKNIFIMKNPTDFGKTVENGVDPCLPSSRAQFSTWWISNNSPLSGWMLAKSDCDFLRWKSKSCKTTVWDSNDSNKIGMGYALSRDLFHFGFFVAAAEFRLGCCRC